MKAVWAMENKGSPVALYEGFCTPALELGLDERDHRLLDGRVNASISVELRAGEGSAVDVEHD